MMWTIKGRASGDLLSLGGRVLVHHDRAELEFLFPNEQVIALPPSVPPEQTMRWQDHPGMAPVTFPLDRREFR